MLNITEETLSALYETLRQTYPDLRIVTKPAVFPNRCTTVGATIFIPSTWNQLTPAAKYIRLQHEQVHLAQYDEYGFWGFTARYVLPRMRWALEQDAYIIEMAAILAVYGAEYLAARRGYYIDQFTGTSYYWMCSKQEAEDWFDLVTKQLL